MILHTYGNIAQPQTIPSTIFTTYLRRQRNAPSSTYTSAHRVPFGSCPHACFNTRRPPPCKTTTSLETRPQPPPTTTSSNHSQGDATRRKIAQAQTEHTHIFLLSRRRQHSVRGCLFPISEKKRRIKKKLSCRKV